jgi:UDP-N-acetylmuramate--alanine ligase
VYAAGEAPLDGFELRRAGVASLKSHGHRDARRLARPGRSAGAFVRAEAKSGDIVVCLGAGDITAYANALPAKLGAAAA